MSFFAVCNFSLLVFLIFSRIFHLIVCFFSSPFSFHLSFLVFLFIFFLVFFHFSFFIFLFTVFVFFFPSVPFYPFPICVSSTAFSFSFFSPFHLYFHTVNLSTIFLLILFFFFLSCVPFIILFSHFLYSISLLFS